MKKIDKSMAILIALSLFLVGGYVYYQYLYLPHLQLTEGWVSSNSWDCPVGHLIKGNLHSHIYHTTSSPYYTRTDARNSECFDTVGHAQAAGFRAPFH